MLAKIKPKPKKTGRFREIYPQMKCGVVATSCRENGVCISHHNCPALYFCTYRFRVKFCIFEADKYNINVLDDPFSRLIILR